MLKVCTEISGEKSPLNFIKLYKTLSRIRVTSSQSSICLGEFAIPRHNSLTITSLTIVQNSSLSHNSPLYPQEAR